MALMRIGIDLGGTKIEIAVLDPGGNERLRKRIPTPRGDYAATVGAIATLVNEADRDLGERGTVGVGTPGALSKKTGRIKNSNSTVLIGKPLREDLERALGREIRMSNDANCLALSEATDGAARNAPVVFAAILGTGVGGGLAIDGRVHDGPNAIAGEWGHTPLPWMRADEAPGPPCYCGRNGCIETFLSGPARAREPSLERYLDRLARGLAVIVDVLDPDAIVLGGGVSNVDDIYTRVPALIRDYVFSDTFDTPLLRAAHGDSSGVRGAAMLWPASAKAAR
ncbi:MAG TPA: ROK family protein [Candidatus Baltobacteraceae bacterium]|nr:ROK family protein [Candidatus Baltobacteraceae bacterium]